MGKKYKKASIGGLFAPLLFDELHSQAYRELSGNAAKAYCHFKRIERIARKGVEQDSSVSFDFTYTEAAKLGFSRSTFNRVIADLLAKGFINIVSQGGRRSCGMSNTRYQLSNRWRDYGKNTFIPKRRYPSELRQ